MVRLKVAELLKERRETAYALAQGAGLTLPRAYRLARPDGRFQRIEADALEALCRYFDVQPGELLEYIEKELEPARKQPARVSRKL